MAASQPLAGERVKHRPAEEGKANGDEHHIQHGLLPVAGRNVMFWV
jgi:hypothetical protein